MHGSRHVHVNHHAAVFNTVVDPVQVVGGHDEDHMRLVHDGFKACLRRISQVVHFIHDHKVIPGIVQRHQLGSVLNLLREVCTVLTLGTCIKVHARLRTGGDVAGLSLQRLGIAFDCVNQAWEQIGHSGFASAVQTIEDDAAHAV